ncbi:hypothetical protein TpMuguga_01g00979 [Theileria parva strain Muguga]|uniref:uncharacterized protein n=1 Tax=Theileria parva strain Muguga TaxID=333668 RepID=UPI001C6207C0|nr:uncharacterized protein TpMuguga_01g00979 [Theileria parva strain Muguga]EAN34217.2 hypothetical protein TpMuguga_01g00979 [Theileria parva strain Muguga]
MYFCKCKFIIILIVTFINVYCVEKCSDLSQESLLIGQYCLSTCDHECVQRVSFPGTINMPLFDHPVLESDCEGKRGRLLCMSTDLTPHGYPLCEVLNLAYCEPSSCACWSSCISRQCPPKFTPKNNQVTNSGCFDTNLRVLCVS